MPYSSVFSAVQALSEGEADGEVLKAILAEPDDDPNDLAALDAAWQDEEVTFGQAPPPRAARAASPPRSRPPVGRRRTWASQCRSARW